MPFSEVYHPTGQHLIAGKRTRAHGTFWSSPVSGESFEFQEGGKADVDRAVRAAEDAFSVFAGTDRADRAVLLERIAGAIDARGDVITAIGTAETGLPAQRLISERARTVGQLRLFAAHIREGAYLDPRHDPPLPDRTPIPRPDLRMSQMPVGPVAVFGASNFPLAFSVAGGDTASALAAGCPIVVKGHPAHPGTGEIVADAIAEALGARGLPPGIFSFLQGSTTTLGATLVQHPMIAAVGFTGSLAAGRALFDLCAARPGPIPFFGELGSINPVFCLPAALKARGTRIARNWVASLTLGVGQFCTNPGVIVLPVNLADAFLTEAVAALSDIGAQPMLTDGIADAFRQRTAELADHPATRLLVENSVDGRRVAPWLLRVSASDWMSSPALREEVFGPVGLAVIAKDHEDMRTVARNLEGQLTCTLQCDPDDHDAARALLPVLIRKAGRIIANGFPTGVEVAAAMVHGGPYPASTNFGATSVGTLAIRRWLRPVCWQDMPETLLPPNIAKTA